MWPFRQRTDQRMELIDDLCRINERLEFHRDGLRRLIRARRASCELAHLHRELIVAYMARKCRAQARLKLLD